ncbi:MAG: two pore domain potassium channel family protein [Ruminococcus sp.]|nr:two pore domain potassium channel family protein [Ruminococcus sp.]MBQ7133881.1 two pore domain potassium channel family protein [Ruminococcus sp.]
MKKLRVLRNILVRTKTNQILLTYIVFVLLSALLILLLDPAVTRYGDALWYCYAVISTAGFGDVVVTTLFSKIISVLVTAYSTIVIAIVTGVVVNFYTEITELSRKETLTAFMDKLEHLDTMSKEELREISSQVKKFNDNVRK